MKSVSVSNKGEIISRVSHKTLQHGDPKKQEHRIKEISTSVKIQTYNTDTERQVDRQASTHTD